MKLSKPIWIAGLMALVLLVLFFYLFPDPSGTQEKVDETSASQDKRKVQQTAVRAGSDSDEGSTSNYAQCRRTLHQVRQSEQQWVDESRVNFSAYLQQGYSLNEVTFAIEALRNSNFAAMFRASQLRKSAEITKINTMLAEELEEHIPGAAGKGLNVQRKVPSDLLKGFAERPLSEQQQIARSGDISVDDVAHVIGEPEFSDDDIILLIDGLPDASATVGYQYLEEALSLLDFAAMAGRLKVFNHLLDAGLTPTHDDYLGSTMEWALSGLMNCCEKRSQRAEIINRLIAIGARARFSEQSAESVRGRFPRRFYRFDEEDIETLRQKFDVNLLTINQRQALTAEAHGRLYRELVAERDAFVEEQLAIADAANTKAECESTVNAVSKQWQPKSIHELVREVVARYGDSPNAVIAELADVSPLAVDFYRQTHDNNAQRMKMTPVIDDVLRPLADGDIDKALAYLQQQSLTDGERWYLVGQIMLFDVSYYQQLQQTGFLPQPLQHHHLKRFELSVDTVNTLNRKGYDITAADNLGKTLLYYAVKEKNPQLTSWLLEQGVPYEGDGQGADPLLLALGYAGSGLTFDDQHEIISTLMVKSPVITEFHLQRMAVVKLKYPERYQRLVAQYPDLAVDDNIELPAAW